MLFLLSADFLKKIKKFFQDLYQNVKQLGPRSNLSSLIWFQTVCKGYQQTTKVTAARQLPVHDISLNIMHRYLV